jgi:predicted nucleotidyltransferase
MDREAVLSTLRLTRARLEALGVRHMFLFGSVARDEASDQSDIDIMVDLDEGTGGRKPLFSALDVGGIQYALCEILGRPVDLVVRSDALRAGARLNGVARHQLLDVF